MGERRHRNSRASAGVGSVGTETTGSEVYQARGAVGARQVLAVLLLVLVQPRTEYANLLGDHRVDASGRVVGLGIPAKWNFAGAGWTIVYKALFVVEFRIEGDEDENPIFQDRTAKGKTREYVAGLRFDRLDG